MRILKLLLISFIVLLSLAVPSFAQEDPSTCIYYFYGIGCPHCAQVSPFLDDLKKEYPDLEIKEFEIYQNRDNAVLFQSYAQKYDMPQPWGIPSVFVEDGYLVGDTPIIGNLENYVLNNPQDSCPTLSSDSDEQDSTTPEEGTEGEGETDENSGNGLGSLSIATVIGAAVVDSINPCAIAVLLILLSAFLLGAQDKRRALKAGLAFSASIYIAYFLFGLGLFSAIHMSGLSDLVYRFIGFFAIIVGLLNLKDYFWYGGGGFVMEIPRRWRHGLKDLLYKATSPLGAFLVGFIVILFELPCTGGPYFFVLGLLADKVTLSQAVIPLLLYNVFFILPLLVITFLVYFEYSNVQEAAKWKERNIRRLHLITGFIMLALGIVVALRLV